MLILSLTKQLTVMLIIGTKLNEYIKNGATQFVYGVKSTLQGQDATDELEAYKASCGSFYREDDKTQQPLFYTQRIAKVGNELRLTTKGRFSVVSNLEEEVEKSELLKAKEMAKLKAAQEFFGMSKAEMLEAMYS